ncbi:MAG: hypothetical protein ABSH44_01705 [Bryobacteraceae bacterium]|jgi:uncharacterized protein (TIGR03437 family)
MNPISAAWLLMIAGALAVPLRAGGSLTQILAPRYYVTGNYVRAYDARVQAGRMALDSAGNLHFVDGLSYPNSVVRKVTPDGWILPVAGYYGGATYLPPGERTPALLGSFSTAYALAFDAKGNLFVAGYDGYDKIFRIASDGFIEYYAGRPPGHNMIALAADAAGDLYVLEKGPGYFQGGSQVLKILPDRTIVPWAGTGTAGYSGDDGPAIFAQINAGDVAVDTLGNLFISDDVNYLIRKVDPQGTIAKVAQGGGPIALDARGNLYFFLHDGTLERLAPDGRIDAVATVPNPGGVAVDSTGNLFVSSNGRLYALDAAGAMRLIAGCACFGDGVPFTWAAAVNPTGLARDVVGNIYFSDAGNHTVRRIAPDGTITLVAGTGDPGFSGDGGPARLARLSSPSGLAFDIAGNLYIADRGNSLIRKVGPDGIIQSVAGSGVAGFSGDGGPATAARIAFPDGVAIDPLGIIYIADTVNHRIRKVTTDGLIQTIAGSGSYGASGDGGPASQALLINPRALAFDLDGSLLIADSSAHMVRRITPAGLMQRVSGTGAPGHTGDGGPAISAQDWTPWGLAVDAAGNILIGDTGTYSIRIVDRSGTIRTLVSSVQATGLSADPNGNVWIAGGSLSLFSQTSSPIPLAPVIANDGVRNTESGQFAVIAPGELVTIGGDRLGPATGLSASGEGGVLGTELGGVRVLFDGIAAPLLQVGAQQIQALVPFAVAGKSTLGIRVEYGGLTSNTAIIGVLPAVPGIFNQYGSALALNTPAGPGSIISLFVTGSGVMVPPEADGQIGSAQTSIPVLRVSASLGVFPFSDTPVPWIPVEVTYAGSASWLISGAIQVNVKLPDKLPETDYGEYPMAVRVGDSLSNFVRVTVKTQ